MAWCYCDETGHCEAAASYARLGEVQENSHL